MQKNIKAFLLVNLATKKTLVQKKYDQQIDLNSEMKKLLSIDSKEQNYKTSECIYGKWHYEIDDLEVGYFVLTDNLFPTLDVQYILRNSVEQFHKLDNFQNLSPDINDKYCKGFLPNLIKIARDDKITKTRDTLLQVQNVMNESLQQILIQDEQLLNLEEKSTSIRNSAFEFNQSSTALKKKMYCKELKNKIISITILLFFTTLVYYTYIYDE